ncbi:MAG: FtsX-like permease family protein [Planctomycetes bacterium]|nr:FtsX-like permease family protein [Planctomycetota bacterium]
MTTGKLIWRSLLYYWRTHLGVMLGVAVCSSILTGAFLVGDSVNYSLNRQALARLGNIHLALAGGDRFFREELADKLSDELQVTVAPVLQLKGLIINSETGARENQVQVLGVDDRFWELGGGEIFALGDNEVMLNKPLADRLRAEVGDEIRLRVAKPELLSRDAPLSLDQDLSVERRLTVKRVVTESEFGRFGLEANQVMPMNAWVRRGRLAELVALGNQVNMLLVGGSESGEITAASVEAALHAGWELADASLELRELTEQNVLEMRSSRIFLEEPIAEAAFTTEGTAQGSLTYFVNEIRTGDKATPYSIVAALGTFPNGVNIVPPEMADDEIIINDWLADDLGVQAGDSIDLEYFVFGPMRRLEEQTSSFRIRQVIPLEGAAPTEEAAAIKRAAADAELMPDYPGLADVDNCRDWQPGIDIDVTQIRDKDEEYWDLYRGTPKAFITLDAGQALWANRFGNLTAVRYPLTDSIKTEVEQAIKTNLDPASVGLFFQPVRQRALLATSQAQDLKGIFIGLSFFIIVAALALIGLLFVFGVEQRRGEVGMLLSMGFKQKQIRRLFLMEGVILAALGSVLGIAGGIIYTKLMIFQLSSVWQGAIAGAEINYHARAITFITGAGTGIVVAVPAMWITLRRLGQQSVKSLLEDVNNWSMLSGPASKKKGKISFVVALICLIASLLMLVLFDTQNDQQAMGVFFGAGFLLLTASLAFSHSILSKAVSGTENLLKSMGNFAIRNASRRRGRSLAVIALLACGSFLVFSVGAFKKDPLANVDQRNSGSGGFTLVGESTLPVLYDLNTQEGREELGLISQDLADLQVVQMRLHEGDDASCLNLNRPQTPRLLGVQPEELARRDAFAFARTVDPEFSKNPWLLLNQPQPDGAIPAITDDNTIKWALDKQLGDTLSYTDERGRAFDVRLVGALKGSILQGSLVISEEALMRHYPLEQGYRVFFMDVPADQADDVVQQFSRLAGTNRDIGMQITTTADRLVNYYQMESTYLSMFQLLGGLGMIFGIAGLAIVVLRNVMERRSELAMLRAIGFSKPSLMQLLLMEHWWLVVLGLGSGVFSAIVAVMPAIRSAGNDIPFVSLAVILAAMFSSSIIWVWLATRLAVRGPLLDALRHE